MSQHHDDRPLVEAAQRDPSRFADLYEQNFYRVYAYISRRVPDRHSAEDLTAEVFCEALAGIRKFEWRGVRYRPWSSGGAGTPAILFRKPTRRARTKSSATPCFSN
jgi:DNA-directed RNA polymerase specialized sigma24 family protein